MALHKPNSALLILAHGSTQNKDSSRPSWLLADAIAKKGQFGSVFCAFWKEDPGFRQVLTMIEQKDIYIVPNFISEGYFTREIIPRELELESPTTVRNGKTLHYCDPVGLHPAMTRLLIQNASKVTGGSIPNSEISLIIVGHGTPMNKQSTQAIKAQVDMIRESDAGFAEVKDAYMEETPFISDWQTLTKSENVVVVPFFIADGLHSQEDIPVLLGIDRQNPATDHSSEPEGVKCHRIDSRSLYYSSAIGSDPAMEEVIVEQVEKFDERYSG
tara:strand:+ start:4107 stop:4922 length:816 start_codon:yes stop_codon:yes gene_type:complete